MSNENEASGRSEPAGSEGLRILDRKESRRLVLIAVAFLGVGMTVFLLARSRPNTDPSNETSQKTAGIRQRIEILFDAANKSDRDRYLDCFAEPLRSRLKKQLNSSPALLGKSERDLKGLVLTPNADEPEGNEATVVVEKLYTDTNERVRFRLRRIDGDWKVVEMRELSRMAPETKYGTPVVPVKRNNR